MPRASSLLRLAALTALSLGCATTPSAPTAPRCEATDAFPDAAAWLSACGRDELIELTRALVAFQTVSAERPAAEGGEFARMAGFLETWAREAGLDFTRVGADDAWELSLGTGPRRLGYVMHADVVPVRKPEPSWGEGARPEPLAPDVVPPEWSRLPFDATVEGGRLYGRGTEDDKGPIAAVLVVMKALARFGAPDGRRLDGQVVAILGTGEEHDWDPMVAYAKTSTHPEHVVSIDASFPVVVGEAGFVSWWLAAERRALHDGELARPGPRIVAAEAGQFLTQVPGTAWMRLVPWGPKADRDALRARIEALTAPGGPLVADAGKITVELPAEGGLVVRVTGTACHSSVADEEGDNALWRLARVAVALDVGPGPEASLLRAVAAGLDGDHHGTRLGLEYAHPVMGPLLVIPTLLRSSTTGAELGVNMRRPAGLEVEAFATRLDRALGRLRETVDPHLVERLDRRWVGRPALVDPESALVKTLLGVYGEVTGDTEAGPTTIRGGTYARLFPGAVSFGPAMPDAPYTGHAPDEYIEVAALERLSRMILAATLRLATAPGEAPAAP